MGFQENPRTAPAKCALDGSAGDEPVYLVPICTMMRVPAM